MPAVLTEPLLESARPLQFACGHCGTVLSVPAALAGIQGPCPCCRGLIVAPGHPTAGPVAPVSPPTSILPAPPRAAPVSLPTAPPLRAAASASMAPAPIASAPMVSAPMAPAPTPRVPVAADSVPRVPGEGGSKRRGVALARRVEAEWDDLPVPPPPAAPKLVAPKPRVPRPAPPPDPEPPAVDEVAPVKRSALRRQVVVEKPNPPPPVTASTRRKPKRDPEPTEIDADPLISEAPTAGRLWTWAGLGAVVGGGLVFAALSALSLKRDTSPGAAYPTPSRTVRNDDDADAVAALAAHKKASAREIKSLLASQQVVWQFFATATADAARPLVSPAISTPLPAAGVQTPLTRLALRSKHRLPDEAGLASQWTVTTTRFGELVVDVTDAGGQPRIDWDKLATQLGAQASASADQRTAATP